MGEQRRNVRTFLPTYINCLYTTAAMVHSPDNFIYPFIWNFTEAQNVTFSPVVLFPPLSSEGGRRSGKVPDQFVIYKRRSKTLFISFLMVLRNCNGYAKYQTSDDFYGMVTKVVGKVTAPDENDAD